MPYSKFFDHPSFFKIFYINNEKTKSKWDTMLDFNYQLMYLGLDKGYMFKLMYIDDDGKPHDVFFKSTCPCCKGDNPDIIYPVIIGRCKHTSENNLRITISALLKQNYMIVDDESNIIQLPRNAEIKIAE